MKISIVTVVYNNCDTISAAIESIISQSHSEIELVVVDGASTDGTVEILRSYESRIAALVSEPDNGIYDALNKGIDLCTGDVVGFLHSDDLLADENAIARVARVMDDIEIDAVYGDLVYVQKSDPTKVVRTWRSGAYSVNMLSSGWMPPHPTFYARRAVYQRLGKFDATYRIAADYDCMLRFLRANIRVEYVPYLQVRMRVGGTSNRSLANIVRKSREDLRALRTNNVGGVFALLGKNLRKLPQFFTGTVISLPDSR